MNRIFCRLKFLVYSITSVTIYYMYFYVQVMFYIFILSISLFILVIILIMCLVLFCFVLSHSQFTAVLVTDMQGLRGGVAFV